MTSIGANIGPIDDYSAGCMLLADQAKLGRIVDAKYQPRSMDTETWPLQPGEHMLILFSAPGPQIPYPAGGFLILFDGGGLVSINGSDPLASGSLYAPDPSGGIDLVIASGTVTNLRVLLPGAKDGDLFYAPVFAQYQAASYSAIRTMLALGIDGNQSSAPFTWAQRPMLSDPRWVTSKGWPLEVSIALANQLGTNLWLNIMDTATSDYVTGACQLVAASFNGHVFIERSNETFNADSEYYPQHDRDQAAGLAAWLAPDAYTAGIYFHALRTRDIGAIARGALGAQRVTVVFGSNDGDSNETSLALAYLAPGDVDAVAIAPYVGRDLGYEASPPTTLDGVFSELNSKYLPETLNNVTQQAAICQQYGVDLIGYEGGQHLVTPGQDPKYATMEALFNRANRDPRMGDLYGALLDGWSAAGGKLLCHFDHLSTELPGGSGRFGVLVRWDDAWGSTVKSAAIASWVAANPPTT